MHAALQARRLLPICNNSTRPRNSARSLVRTAQQDTSVAADTVPQAACPGRPIGWAQPWSARPRAVFQRFALGTRGESGQGMRQRLAALAQMSQCVARRFSVVPRKCKRASCIAFPCFPLLCLASIRPPITRAWPTQDHKDTFVSFKGYTQRDSCKANSKALSYHRAANCDTHTTSDLREPRPSAIGQLTRASLGSDSRLTGC